MTGDYYEVIIDGQRIDLYDQVDIPVYLSFVLLDLNYFDKRGGAFSNIFKVPATKNNNKIFNWYFDGQVGDRSIFVKDKSCQINVNGITVFDGTIVGKASYEYVSPKEYEVNVRGSHLIWADVIADLPLVELTYPTVNYTPQVIKDSWDNTWEDRYVAPLVFYGKPRNMNYYQEPGTAPGSGVFSQAGNLMFYRDGQPDQTHLGWEFCDFRFWLFTRPLIEEMFQRAGYTIVSDFLQGSDEGSKHVMYINDLNVYFKNTGNDLIENIPAFAFPYEINLGKDLIKSERRCIDLLKGIQDQFNLFFYTDEINKKVYIEPYDKFFTSSMNWEIKIDYSKVIKVNPYSDVQRVFMQHKLTDPVRDHAIKHNMEKAWPTIRPYNTTYDSLSPAYNERWYYPTNEYYRSAFINNSRIIKTIENNFFGSYFMMHTLVKRTADGFPIYFYLSPDFDPGPGNVNKMDFSNFHQYAGIVMPIITEDSFSDPIFQRVDFISASGDRLFEPQKVRYMPEASVFNGPEPRFGYYAGMTEIKKYNTLERGETGPPEFVFVNWDRVNEEVGFPSDPDFDTYSTRPFVYNCDYLKEDCGPDGDLPPRNYQYTNQLTNINVFDFFYGTTETIRGLMHKHFINNIISLYSDRTHVSSMHLKLTEIDINQLDFRKQIELRYRKHILLEVSKFNPLVSETTQTSMYEPLIATQEDIDRMLYGSHHCLDMYDLYFCKDEGGRIPFGYPLYPYNP